MSHKYSVILVWSDEDKAFIASVNELPGCKADGATQAQALEAIELVIGEWIETAKAEGRKVPKPLTVEGYEKLAHRFHASIEQRVRREAEAAVSEAVKRVIEQIGLNPMLTGMADPADYWKRGE